MRSPIGTFIFVSVMLLFDTYVFQAVKAVSQSASPKTRTIIYGIYWAVTALAIIGFLVFVFSDQNFLPKKVRTYLFATILGLFLAKFTAILFFFLDDVRRGIQWVAERIFNNNSKGESIGGDPISRSVFLSWLGLGVGSGLFGSLVYGFGNKYKYDIKRVQLAFKNLPVEFKGMKILHISDIHSGSFTDKTQCIMALMKY